MSGWETRLSNLEGLSAEEKGFVTCKLLLLDDDAKAARFFVGDDKATVKFGQQGTKEILDFYLKSRG